MGGNFTEGYVILSPGTQQEDTRGMLKAPRLKTFNKQVWEVPGHRSVSGFVGSTNGSSLRPCSALFVQWYCVASCITGGQRRRRAE